MRILSWALYALAILLALAGIYVLTLGGQFVILGVMFYILCWPLAWLAGKARRRALVD